MYCLVDVFVPSLAFSRLTNRRTPIVPPSVLKLPLMFMTGNLLSPPSNVNSILSNHHLILHYQMKYWLILELRDLHEDVFEL